MLTHATEADHAAIVNLANAAYRGTGAAASWNSEAGIMEGQRLNVETLREDIAAKPGAHMLVWREDSGERLLGGVWLEPKSDAVWYLGLLAVQPDQQQQQLGRTLLAAAEDFTRLRGAQTIRMTVVNVRTTLIAWYERRGYRLTGETESFTYTDERFGRPLRNDLQFVVLEKNLSSQPVLL